MINRIAICGIPASGTKLLNHMVACALPSWDYNPRERGWAWNWYKERIITKMPRDVFEYSLMKKYEMVLPIITVRDPYFVLTTKHRTDRYWMTFQHIGKTQAAPIYWYREVLKWMKRGELVVRYEDLIKDPDKEQVKIFEKLGMVPDKTFSEFESHPMPEGYESLQIIRPLSSARTTLGVEDWEWLDIQLRGCPELNDIREELGYASFGLS